jgi:dethiobiotin synthetase
VKGRGLIITGTDTGVGKTVVTALLASCLLRRGVDVGVMKPVASGCENINGYPVSQDALFLKEKLVLDEACELITPVCYREPLAPAAASRIEGVGFDIGRIERAYETLSRRHDIILVEGIGGILVPLDEKSTLMDIALRWALPLLVVARPGLGTINHTALTVSCARSAGCPVAGVVFNACEPPAGTRAEEWNPRCVERFCNIPFWGTIPYGGESVGDGKAWERLCSEGERIFAPHIDAFVKPALDSFTR